MTAVIPSLSPAIKDNAMLMRLLAVALLAGLTAGAVTGVVQVLHLQPLILEAERYEGLAQTDHHHGAEEATPTPSPTPGVALSEVPHDHDQGDATLPPRETPSFQRVAFLVVTSMISGVAFALLLTAIYTLLAQGQPLLWTPAQGPYGGWPDLRLFLWHRPWDCHRNYREWRQLISIYGSFGGFSPLWPQQPGLAAWFSAGPPAGAWPGLPCLFCLTLLGHPALRQRKSRFQQS